MRHISNSFTPLGVIQGWSPGSMAEAARRLVAMGYDYLALGGTVPLKAPQIKACLSAIRDAVPQETRLHILGFAKANEIESFAPLRHHQLRHDVAADPRVQGREGELLPARPGDGRLAYYTAIRVPQALENTKLLRLVKRGVLSSGGPRLDGARGPRRLRAYDREECGLEETLEAVLAYAAPVMLGATLDDLPGSSSVEVLRERYHRTLTDRPWLQCSCAICRAIRIEVIIFRASNRNKRRGIHNLGVYEALVKSLDRRELHDGHTDLFRHTSSTEPVAHGSLLRGASVRAEAVCGD